MFPPGNGLTRSGLPGFIGAQYSHAVLRAPITRPDMGERVLQFKRRQALSETGEVAERLIALVLKTSRRASASGVRIPPSPPVRRPTQLESYRMRQKKKAGDASPPPKPPCISPKAQLGVASFPPARRPSEDLPR